MTRTISHEKQKTTDLARQLFLVNARHFLHLHVSQPLHNRVEYSVDFRINFFVCTFRCILEHRS